MRLLVNEQYDGAWNTRSKNKSKIIVEKLGCTKYAGAEITRANTVFYLENKLKRFPVLYIFRAVRLKFRVIVILVKIGSLKAVLFLGAQMKFHLCVYPETMRYFESKEHLLQHLIHHLQFCYFPTVTNNMADARIREVGTTIATLNLGSWNNEY